MQKTVIYKLKEFPTPSETFVVSNMVAAIDAGYEVEIVTDIRHPLSFSSQPELTKKYKLLKRTKTLNNTLLNRWSLLDPFYLFYFLKFCILKRKFDLWYLHILGFYRKYRKNTVFHVHFGSSLPPLHYLKRIGFLKSKIVVTFHGYGAHFLASKETAPQLIKFYNEAISRVTVNSNYLKQILLKKGIRDDLIEVVPIGIDSGFFSRKSSKKPSEVLKLITIGRCIPLKGQHLGLRLMEKLISKGLSVQYTLVGEGPEVARLKALATELNISDHIVFAGEKSQAEIAKLLEDQDVFLMTSTADKDGRREAFGLVSLEAQAMELVVVGFNSGGFPETLRDGVTGYMVPDGDLDAMAQKVEFLYNDRSLLLKMGAEGRKFVTEQFSKQNTTDKYLDLY